MKKFFLSIMTAMTVLTVFSQSYDMEISLKDGSVQKIPADMVSEVKFVESSDPQANINILTEEYIPDAVLRNAIKNQVANGNEVLTMAEAAAFDGGLELESPYVQNFKGIEYLASLSSLKAASVFATSLDISALTQLQELDINHSMIATLNLGEAENLRVLNISTTPLTNFDLSVLPEAMTVIRVDQLDYETLDFTRFSQIEIISCAQNKLVELNVKGLASLKKITFSTNSLKEISFAGCTVLDEVVGTYNLELSSVDFNGCGSLRSLMFMYTSLSGFDASACSDTLEELNLGWTKLESLNIANCEKLTYLAVNNTEFADELNLSKCPDLSVLRVEATKIPSLDLSACPAIAELQCYEIPTIKSVKLAENLTDLFQLNIDNCPMLESFEWGKTEKLEYANIFMVPLTRLDISKINKDYRNLYFADNENLKEIKVWEGFDIDNPPTNIQKPADTKFVYEFSE